MTTSLPDAAAVRRALERRDLVYGLSVDQVMSVVGPVLEERDAEIARLRDAVEGLRLVRAMHVCGESGSEEEEPAAILGEPPPGALL